MKRRAWLLSATGAAGALLVGWSLLPARSRLGSAAQPWPASVPELDGAVYVFDYEARLGSLTAKQSISALPAGFSGRPAAADLHITPAGKFLYSSARTSSTVSSFTINPSSGALTRIETVPTETVPRGFNIDSSGRYLLVAGQSSHRLSVYRIDPRRGSLTRLKDYPVGRSPNWIEIIDVPFAPAP